MVVTTRKRYAAVIGILATLAVIVLAVWAAYAIGSNQNKSTTTVTENSTQNSKDSKGDKPAAEEPVIRKLPIYYIAIDDGGESGSNIGCGDSAVSVETEPVKTTNAAKSALDILLANHEKDYGQSGLYNALYQSRMTVDDVAVEGDTVKVKLSGTITQGGECDSPRIEAQLTHTTLAASGVENASITVNGKSLQDALSLR